MRFKITHETSNEKKKMPIVNPPSSREIKRARKNLEVWQVRTPKYIQHLTPEEIYIQGFASGYKCCEAQMERKREPVMEFKFLSNKKKPLTDDKKDNYFSEWEKTIRKVVGNEEKKPLTKADWKIAEARAKESSEEYGIGIVGEKKPQTDEDLRKYIIDIINFNRITDINHAVMIAINETRQSSQEKKSFVDIDTLEVARDTGRIEGKAKAEAEFLKKAKKSDGLIENEEEFWHHLSRLERCSECNKEYFDKWCPSCIGKKEEKIEAEFKEKLETSKRIEKQWVEDKFRERIKELFKLMEAERIVLTDNK